MMTRALSILLAAFAISWAQTTPVLSMSGSQYGDSLVRAHGIALRVLDGNITQDGIINAGAAYGAWTRDAAINAWYAASLVRTRSAETTLWHHTWNQQISGQEWDKIIWVIAAWNHYCVTGDTAFLRNAYLCAAATFTERENQAFNSQWGLFNGPAVYGDGSSAYPDPPCSGGNFFVGDCPGADDLMCLSTNAVYCESYRCMVRMGERLGMPREVTDIYATKAQSLKAAINQHLWIPAQERFGYFRSGTGVLDQTMEGLGAAFVVLFDIADEDKAQSMLDNQFMSPRGIPCTWPVYPRYSQTDLARHNGTIWPHINGYWALAAVHKDRTDIMDHELISLTRAAIGTNDFMEIYWPWPERGYTYPGGYNRQTWCATAYMAMIYRGLVGMNFEPGGIRFAPAVPRGMGTVSLSSISYRGMTLDVTITGDGTLVKSFTLDNVVRSDPFLPADLTGTHSIRIEMWKGTPVFDEVFVTPVSATVLPGATRQFAAVGRDQFGEPLALQPQFTWSISNGQSISNQGLFTCGATVGGPYMVTATAQVGGIQKTGTALISVRDYEPGITFAYFETGSMPGLAQSPARTGIAANFALTAVSPRPENFAVRFTGLIEITAAGQYTFFTTSDDGSVLYVNNTRVVDNDGAHAIQERSGAITLSTGLHPLRVDYFQEGGESVLLVAWQGPGIVKQPIPDGSLVHSLDTAVGIAAEQAPRTPHKTPPVWKCSEFGIGVRSGDELRRVEIFSVTGRRLSPVRRMATGGIVRETPASGVCIVRAIDSRTGSERVAPIALVR